MWLFSMTVHFLSSSRYVGEVVMKWVVSTQTASDCALALCQVLADKIEAEIKNGHVIFPEEHLAAFISVILLSQQVSLCSLRATRE